MNRKHFLAGLLIAMGVFSCGKDKKDSERRITGPFLTSGDQQSKTDSSNTKEEIERHMRRASSTKRLYANAQKSKNHHVVQIDCPAANAIVAHASGDTLTIGDRVDISSCIKEVFSELFGPTVSITAKAELSAYGKYVCTGRDLSSLDGKKLVDITTRGKNFEICSGTGPGEILTNMQVSMHLVISKSGETFKVESEIKTGLTSENGTSCKANFSQTETTYESCVDFYKTTELKKDSNSKKVELERATRHQLVESNDKTSPFFKNGSIEYFVNGWSGRLNYTDANVAPTYSMTNGTEVVTGTLEAPQNTTSQDETAEVQSLADEFARSIVNKLKFASTL